MTPIDPTKAKVKATYPHAATFYALCADPSGKRLYAGSEDYGIYVFDLDAPKKESVARWTKHDNYVSALVAVAAVDVDASSTRKEEILLSPEELKITWQLRRVLHALEPQQALELLMEQLRKTRSNAEFLLQVQKTTLGS